MLLTSWMSIEIQFYEAAKEMAKLRSRC